ELLVDPTGLAETARSTYFQYTFYQQLVDGTVMNDRIRGEFTSVSLVPLPAAVWLFGSALAGLGWMRRKAL
ncbi:MAG: VPLPA-CTERM sorting domain-containing protein, partial [Gammaproteobacteria bacterium]